MSEPDWRDLVRALAARAPEWMRERSSAALHIGGFTNVELEVPVLEVADLEDGAAAGLAMVFFLAVCAAEDVAVARVRSGRGPARTVLAAQAHEAFGNALARLDDENSALMGYFDVYFRPAEELESMNCVSIVAMLQKALEMGSKQ